MTLPWQQCLTSTAVDHNGASVGVVGAHTPAHSQHGCGILGHTVVRPGGEVELTDIMGLHLAKANLCMCVWYVRVWYVCVVCVWYV